MRVALVDYDSGNLHSAEKAFQLMGRDAGAEVVVTSDPEVAAKADRIVRTLPNAAAAIGRSFTPWYAEGAVSDSDKAVVRAIFAAAEPGADPFRPFGTAERQRLRARYEVDLDHIARAFPDVLMRFEPGESVA